MDDELKPCPFCGGKAKYDDNFYKNGTGHYVYCENCGASSCILIGENCFSKKYVFDQWNRRVNDANSN